MELTTPELVAYVKAIVRERGITREEMNQEAMKDILVEAITRMHKMVDDVLSGHDIPGHRYHDAIAYMASKTYNEINLKK